MRLKPSVGLLLVILIIALPIFGRLGALPIQLWDESRLAVNALEMYYNHNWLVTYYDGNPDLWNTKPPLLIWLQVISLHAFGVNELAIRLPSALAGVTTCFLLYWFILKKFNNAWWGVLSCFVLITSLGFIKYHHSPRTGDYDALLTLLMLAYALCFYIYLEEGKPKYLTYTFVFLTLATLTKGVPALILLPALLAYSLLYRKTIGIFKERRFYIGGIIFLFVIIGYYLLREHASPGYLAAVKYNDFTGRYLHPDRKDRQYDIKYYYDLLISEDFRFWYWFIIPGACLGYFSKNSSIQKFTVYLVLLSGVFLLAISTSQSKTNWYDMPLYPFLSVIVALAIWNIVDWLAAQQYWNSNLRYNVLPLLFFFILCVRPYKAIIHAALEPDTGAYQAENEGGAFFVKDILHGKRKITDTTYIAGWDYKANIDWYLKFFAKHNYPVKTADYLHLQAGQKVMAYEERVKNHIDSHYQSEVLETKDNVTVYRINGFK